MLVGTQAVQPLEERLAVSLDAQCTLPAVHSCAFLRRLPKRGKCLSTQTLGMTVTAAPSVTATISKQASVQPQAAWISELGCDLIRNITHKKG